ncbi:ABC transporter permease [Georgenia sp. SYP-B2076]|uniref:ABC transporter permease n=1 Tax=Georgenia sp. SYP-B2076 TaxID=2495881 RepID=UPI000F8D3416|nr:ABC transporter permease [Georgenia sp. SYP-B2076]
MSDPAREMFQEPARLTPPTTTGRMRGHRKTRTRTPSQKRMIRTASTIVILVAWEIYGRTVNPVIFTYPTAIARAFVAMVRDGTLGQALVQTLIVLAIGTVIGSILGILLGLLAGRSETFGAIIEVPVNALYATPTVALIPLVVVWFGFGATAKTVVVTFFVIFPVLINTIRGVQEVDQELIEVTQSFCSPERRVWRDLLMPSALPYIFTGLRLAIGRGLVGVIVAEFFTAISGLGNLIVTNANTFQTDRMFVPIVLLSVIGVILTSILAGVEKAVAPWRRGR